MRLLVLTDRRMAAAAGHPLIDVVAAATSQPELAGAPVSVVLREKDLPPGERAALAERLRDVTGRAGVALIVASDAGLAASVGADGVHLAAADLWPDPWPSGPAPALVGRSCHTPAEVRAAAAEGAAYVTYSPVFATSSKPGYGPAVGLDGLAAARDAARGMPVVALGGIGPAQVAPCLAAGASGVAVMGEVMRAADPAAVVRALVAGLAVGGGARG